MHLKITTIRFKTLALRVNEIQLLLLLKMVVIQMDELLTDGISGTIPKVEVCKPAN